MNETNYKQVCDMQSQCYNERLGKIYGDFKVIDVWYDWQTRKQMWKLQCTKCGKTKITHNGQDYVKGKNKGNCTCGKDLVKVLRNSEKIKKDSDCTDVSRIKSRKQPPCTCKSVANNWADPIWVDQRFGHLVIQEYVGNATVSCVCDCGGIVNVKGADLLKGNQRTCGIDCIFHNEKVRTHGLSNDRLYRIWKGMRQRCYNPKAHGYSIYGGRGIDICDEWRDDVFAFREWALSHGYSDDLSIDRIDCDKGYSPDNCRWATAEEQANNQHPRCTFTPKRKVKRNRRKTWAIDGVEKSIQEWCAEYGLTVQSVLYRVNTKGMTPLEALTTPKQQGASLGHSKVNG